MQTLRIESVPAAEAIPREAWDRLAPAGDPFLNADFFAITERHGAAGPEWGWRAMHLVARDAVGTVRGILPRYLKGNGYGDFIHDWAWAGAYRQLGKAWYPRLMSGLAHTPATGPRFLVGPPGTPGADAARDALIAAARRQVEELGVSSWHVGFPSADELAALQEAGLLSSDDVQFHWRNEGHPDFDAFLGSLASARRKKVRAERRRVAESGLAIEVRHGDEVDPHEWPALHALYASTFEKFSNHAVFTAGCFAELAAALGRRMVLFIARAEGRPVALSLCYRSDEALYGRYWGTTVDVDCLHFELCFYRGIAYCLDEGLQRFEPGAGGEHKIARGFRPTLVRSAHWIADERMRAMVARHLQAERAAVASYRDDASEHLPFRRAAVAAPAAG